MAIHESAGMCPWEAAKQALRDKLQQALESKKEVEQAVFEAATEREKSLRDRIYIQAHEAATSHLNDLPEPTKAQKMANRYQHGHIKLHGFDITIETPKGSPRKGVDQGGKAWSVTMPAHYGYIKGTVGVDEEHVDVYIGDHPKSDKVFVVDQLNIGDGSFDEHKAILACSDAIEARSLYDAGFSDGKGPDRVGAMTELSVDSFKEWLLSKKTSRPMSGAVFESAPGSIKINTDNGETTVSMLLSRIAKTKSAPQKNELYLSTYGNDRHALIEAAILKLPPGTYTLSIKGRAAPALKSTVESIYGINAMLDVDERLIRGMAVKYPKSIQATLTLGLQEVRILGANGKPVLESAFDWRDAISKASTFAEKKSVFDRLFHINKEIAAP